MKLQQESANNVQTYFNNTSILVIAHPDDETMFFGPTIYRLIENRKSLVILCLSSGDDKLTTSQFDERELELVQVAKALGSNVKLTVIKDKFLVDGLDTVWSADIVSNYVEIELSKDKQIKTLFTFDSYGISGHPNHRSIYNAIVSRHKTYGDKVRVLLLKSVSIWRKYISFLDSIFTVHEEDTIAMAIDFSQYSSLKQVLKLHKSQIVWFRQLYMIFSRYMFLNDYRSLPNR